jgi:hypothetical protein
MSWRGGTFALLLVVASPGLVYARHGGEILLDARRATPGIQLELVEIPSAQASTTNPRYRLRVKGLPADVTVGIWTKDFGSSFRELVDGFRADGTGALVRIGDDGRPVRLDKVVLEPDPHPSGAAWEVALASADKTVAAFARVIPRPIAAKVGSCALSLELVSRRGDRFVASGSGFAPGEDVTIESQDSGGVIRKRQRVGADGRLPADEIWHRSGDSHDARYEVKSSGCAVAVSYRWGEPTLVQR